MITRDPPAYMKPRSRCITEHRYLVVTTHGEAENWLAKHGGPVEKVENADHIARHIKDVRIVGVTYDPTSFSGQGMTWYHIQVTEERLL